MTDYSNINIINRAQGAIIAAAYGDALGWPNERIYRTIPERIKTNGRLSELKEWKRLSGGRYYRYDQIIDAGTYSDDTQLILCVSRALLCGQQWWEWFCHIELPFWSLYEKGGGGATKRAAKVWEDGIHPWSEKRRDDDLKKYFHAGGNGVAMRILPHILYNVDTTTYTPIAQNILLDGISTHGHPRALVGALAYGYGLWKSIRRTEQLKYGEIIDDLLSNSEEWGTLPESNSISSEWLQVANQHIPDYQGLWMRTVGELTSYLEICQTGISKGALALDDEILRSLHCFDRNVSGAGTVATAAAVYLASRYAPDPMNGIIKAAYAIGSDTDTIASMTAGILGTFNGLDWVNPVKSSVQDSEYLHEMAKALIKKDTLMESLDIPRLGIKSHLKKFRNELFKIKSGQSIGFPDGRRGEIVSIDEMIGKTRRFKVLQYRIKIDDGQSIGMNRIVRGDFADKQPTKTTKTSVPMITPLNLGIKLPTHKLSESKWFYKDLLGLEITKETKDIVVFDQGLSLVPDANYSTSQYGGNVRTLVYLEVEDLETLFYRLKDVGINILTSPSPWNNSKRTYFACNDPDGNIIEIFSLNKSSTMKTIAVN